LGCQDLQESMLSLSHIGRYDSNVKGNLKYVMSDTFIELHKKNFEENWNCNVMICRKAYCHCVTQSDGDGMIREILNVVCHVWYIYKMVFFRESNLRSHDLQESMLSVSHIGRWVSSSNGNLKCCCHVWNIYRIS
jgi:hypothetical protein